MSTRLAAGLEDAMSDVGKVAKMALGTALAAAVLLWGTQTLAEAPKEKAKPAAAAPRVVKITVTENGYEPSPITVKKGEPLKLVVTRKVERTCATELLIKDTDINVPLPLNTTVEIPYTPDKTGKIKYGCAMGMMISGVLLVE
ncbi:MAG: cupredoxin domain-containing protein [Myxococcota bacterium]